ncbi:MAG: ABC transporter ATP-binding protein [Alphaproteobacteria bacterium]|nr:ABC transporter ATP-binding protein [Alphaproteobacteria bacterium]
MAAPSAVIEIDGLVTRFGQAVIHEDLDLSVERGEVFAIVGGSGTGKSVLLREIVGLMRPAEGRVRVLGHDVARLDPGAARHLRRRWGMLFQDGALFSSLTVGENIDLPLKEHTDIDPATRRRLAQLKLGLVGLPADTVDKYPAELSGGMRKRAGLARALALDPELLFLDEPTAGLDPIAANGVDELVRSLRRALGLTVVMVTHDLDSLHAISDRIGVLVDKRIRVGTIASLIQDDHPWIRDYFRGPRGRAAAGGGGKVGGGGEG